MAELIREIVIDATPETIWPFLTEADKYVEWLGTVAETDPHPGGIFQVLVAGQHQSAGEFVEVVPNEKVVFTFGWAEKDHPIPPGSTTVEITLHPEGNKTLVRLAHRGLPADAVEDHGRGWAGLLEQLASAAAGRGVVILAHIGGIPVEELLIPFVISAGGALIGVRDRFRWSRQKHSTETRERSPQ